LSFTAQVPHHLAPATAITHVAGTPLCRRARHGQGRYRAASGGRLRPAL